jgi:hypothetical protein
MGLIIAAPLAAFAQLTTGTITGVVHDASGAVVPGASVTLVRPGVIGANQTTTTDARGIYLFARLVPGTYGVRVELEGFTPAMAENIVVNADATVRADLVVTVGGLSDTVTVTGETPLLDTTSTLTQTVLERQILDKIPSGNDLWSIGRSVPGVIMTTYDVGGSNSYQASFPTSHGSVAAENKYLIDGMDVSSANFVGAGILTYYDSMMFEEINYQVGGASAENSQGGVVMNMVTKTGTNDFHGSFMISGSNKNLQASNVTADLRRDLLANVPAKVLAANPDIQPGNKILDMYDSSLSLSGPIVRNRLWFATTGRLQALNQLQIGSYNPDGTQAIDDNKIKNGSVKVSWQASPANQVHFTFNRNLKYRYHRRGGTFVEDRASTLQDQPTNIVQLKWTSTISPKVILDVSSSVQRGTTPSREQKEVQPGDLPRTDLVTLVSSVAAPTYSLNPQYKGVFNGSASYFAGKHELKAGYQFVRGMSRRSAYSMSHYPAGLLARYRNDVPDSVQVFNTPYDTVGYFHDNAIYVQDKWTPVSKLTAMMGLRLQKSFGWIPPVCQPETIFIQGQCFDEVSGFPDYLDLAPRFGLVYDVFGDGRTALKFAANRYHLSIGGGFVDRLNPVTLKSETRQWSDRNADLIPQLDELGPGTGFNLGTTNRYNPDVKRAYSDEFSIEFERQVFGELVLSVGYTHREIKNNVGPRNMAVPAESYIPLVVTERVSGREVTVYNQDARTRGRFDVLWDNQPELDSEFNGIDISFNKRLRNRWMLMGGFSVGRNIGDTYSETSDLNNPNFTFRRGVTEFDVPVSFKLSGIYEMPLGIQFSGKLQHFSGFPESPTVLVTSQTVALTQVSQSVRVAAPGETRLPSVNMVDLRFSKSLQLRGTMKIEPALDIFNVANASPIQSRVTQLGPAFGRANEILRGRLFRAGFYLTF